MKITTVNTDAVISYVETIINDLVSIGDKLTDEQFTVVNFTQEAFMALTDMCYGVFHFKGKTYDTTDLDDDTVLRMHYNTAFFLFAYGHLDRETLIERTALFVKAFPDMEVAPNQLLGYIIDPEDSDDPDFSKEIAHYKRRTEHKVFSRLSLEMLRNLDVRAELSKENSDDFLDALHDVDFVDTHWSSKFRPDLERNAEISQSIGLGVENVLIDAFKHSEISMYKTYELLQYLLGAPDEFTVSAWVDLYFNLKDQAARNTAVSLLVLFEGFGGDEYPVVDIEELFAVLSDEDNHYLPPSLLFSMVSESTSISAL